MKKLLVLSVFIASIFYGCEKQDLHDQLNGTWKIIGIGGSFQGWQTVKDFDLVSFSESGTYTVFYENAAVEGGSYKIEKFDPKKYGSTSEYHVNFNKSYNHNCTSNFYTSSNLAILFCGNDTLYLSEYECTDGFSYGFVRK